MASSVSSRPQAPTVAPWLARSTRPGARGAPRCCRWRSAPRPPASRARRPAQATGRDRPAAPSRPGSSGCRRAIWARYSPSPMRTISSSISPKRPAVAHALGIGGKLPHRLDIGRKPGQPMCGALLAVEQPRAGWPSSDHPLAHLRRGVGQQRLDRGWSRLAPWSIRRVPATGGERMAACGMSDGPACTATRSSSVQRTIASATGQSCQRRTTKAQISDIFNRFSGFFSIAGVACRPASGPFAEGPHPMSCRSTASSPRISVRTRIILLAVIPVVGFLVNGIAYHVRRARSRRARSIPPSARRDLAEASREFRGALDQHARADTDFASQPSQDADRRFR